MKSQAIILEDRAAALARYPHARIVGDLIFVSGVSSRRPDNTHDGVIVHADGRIDKDIRAQTRAVIENIRAILHAADADLDNLVDITVYLVDMRDYAGMNEVYDQYFTKEQGPARTTLAVHQLPHPNLLIEMKVVACIR